jgi:hypothetical protein
MSQSQQLAIHGRNATVVIPEGWEISDRVIPFSDNHIVRFTRDVRLIEVNFHPDPDYPEYLQVCPHSRGYTLQLNNTPIPLSVSGTLNGGDISITLEVKEKEHQYAVCVATGV